MKKIKLKKISLSQLEVLQQELHYYSNFIAENSLKTDFLNAIIALDIASQLYFLLRNKIEKEQKQHNISLSITQAAIIEKCCNYNRYNRSEYQKNVMLQLIQTINPQLKSLINNTMYT